MNEARSPSAFAGLRGATLLALVATILLGAFAIDRQSLWLDELGTWRLTLADGWGTWLTQLLSQTGSNAQLLAYHLYMRLWTLAFSTSELSLRAANLPWLFLAFLALVAAPVAKARRRTAHAIAVVLFAHPMTWHYANEARPYAMMFCGAALAGSGLLGRLDAGDASRRRRAKALAWAGLALLAWTSPIGVVWSLAFALPLVAQDRAKPPAGRPGLAGVGAAAAGVSLVLLACAYYAFTAFRGVEATTVHEHEVANFAFGLYEIAGLGGLGPGREELRLLGPDAMKHGLVPVVAGSLALAGVAGLGVLRLLREARRPALGMLAGAVASFVLVFLLAAVLHWRAVGRHLLPLIWFFALALASGIERLLENRAPRSPARIGRVLLAALAVLALAVSSFEIATARRHEREDYRGASRLALENWNRGGATWWVAGPFGASYYGLDPVLRESEAAGAAGRLQVVVNRGSGEILALPPPDLVVLSRRDTYDVRGAVTDYVRGHGYRCDLSLPGFEIWTR